MMFKPLFTKDDIFDADIEIALATSISESKINDIIEGGMSASLTDINEGEEDCNTLDMIALMNNNTENELKSSIKKNPNLANLNAKINPTIRIANKSTGVIKKILSVLGIKSPLKRARTYNRVAQAITLACELGAYSPHDPESSKVSNMIKDHHKSMRWGNMSVDDMLVAAGFIDAVIQIEKEKINYEN